MANAIHPAAPHFMPVFITAPGQTDMFLYGAGIFLVLGVIALGVLYFKLHALPEHMAHGRANQLQFELVAVLSLIALFTHQTAFWIAALILAFVPVPDFHAPLAAMAESLARMTGKRKTTEAEAPVVSEPVEAVETTEPAAVAPPPAPPVPETPEADKPAPDKPARSES